MNHWYSWLSPRKLAVIVALLIGVVSGSGFSFQSENSHVISQTKDKSSATERYKLKYSNKTYDIKLKNQNSLQTNNIWLTNNYVSIAQLDQQLFVTANYTNLFLIDLKNNESCVLVPDSKHYKTIRTLEELGNTLKSSEKAIYNPAGVYIDKLGDLYVANYKGNNILKGRIDKKSCQVKFVQNFSSDDTGGPENVAVDHDNNILISANYDSGTIAAFRLSNGTPLWTATIGQAHGVTIKGDKVYATGLTERKIYELALSDGRLLRSTGSLGWDPLNNEFLWPTTIYPVGEKELVIADPQTGYISFFDQEKFAVTRYIGGNGPGEYLFNYPYAAVPTKDSLFVLSSMRGEMIETNLSGNQALKRYRLQESIWPVLPASIANFGEGWKGYVNEGGPSLNIYNKSYKLGFGHIHPVEAMPTFRVPDIATLYNNGAYLYFLQGGKIGHELSYFFSSSSGTLLGVYQRLGKPAILLHTQIPLDSWLVNHEIVSSNGENHSEVQIQNHFSKKAAFYYDEIEKRGWLPTEQLFQLNTGSFPTTSNKLTFTRFIQDLDSVFVSPEGRKFKFVYDKCATDNCNINSLKATAKNYYSKIISQSYVNIDEYLLVGMLSGVSAKEASLENENVKYDACGTGKYYDGYGLNTLTTPSLDDYLSAHDIATSSVCFSNNSSDVTPLKGVTLVWNSQEEIPKQLAIYGISENNEETLLQSVDKVDAVETGGYLSTSLTINSPHNYPRYQLKLIEGGKQNRLILRALVPEFAESNATLDNEKVKYDDCGTGKYYDGYGLNTLTTPSLDDYLSAHDIATSSVCFSNNSSDVTPLKGVTLVWNSQEEIPKQLAIYGISENNKETLLQKVDKIDSVETGGYLSTSLTINNSQNYPRYQLKLIEGGKQNRLILRALVPEFAESNKNIKTYDSKSLELATP